MELRRVRGADHRRHPAGAPGLDHLDRRLPRRGVPAQLGARVDRLLTRVAPLLELGNVAFVGHAHTLRVVGARWIGLPASGGGKLRLDTATVSVLGHEHGRPVILRWNGG